LTHEQSFRYLTSVAAQARNLSAGASVDPEFILTGTWLEIAQLLVRMWVFVLFQVVFAFSLLLAHAVIPSLIDTGHLPAATNRIRPVLYGGFFLFMFAAAATIATVFWVPDAMIQTIYEVIYNRRWI
jgi:hypothetical protein